ncbi:MAG: polymorphic toxin-type HINT domain-containing protein [Thiohalomonadales bacterium]
MSPNGQLTTIGTTDDHSFYVIGEGWVDSVDLEAGEFIETYSESYVTVNDVIATNRIETTYNFTIADCHTFFVTEYDLLVHNCGDKARGRIILRTLRAGHHEKLSLENFWLTQMRKARFQL